MFSSENDDDVVVCPYNKAHHMLRKRLQPHLIKCRQNYPQLELQKCPFNSTHHIPEPEFTLHVTNCPDRKLITQYKYDTVAPKEEEPIRQIPIECEENWDDTEVDDYDPQKFIAEKNVLRKPMGIPPAERKEFIKQERKRLGDEESYSESDDDYEEKGRTETTITDVNKKDEDEESVSVKRIRSISPSPPRQAARSRSRSPISAPYAHFRHIDERNSYLPTPLPPPRISGGSGDNRYSSYHKRERSSLPATYDIDDDPYYNSGTGSSDRYDNYNSSNNSHYPRLVAYPTRMPSYGRGAYRGYNYDRRNSSRNGDFR
ncbi:protein D7 [Zeugodacus cucurbitae]|uniref:protein D7 n=1 Tax=Zeugodacus cucurbitae TaxID=28588 RepID=UPI0005969834|nr:protein D7 [Zeugodacus cucurbitae]